jgi:protein gp37
LKWNRKAEGLSERPRVFCASLADWLDDEVPLEWLRDLLDLIRLTPNLDWLLLTKRPDNFLRRVGAVHDGFARNCLSMDEADLVAWTGNMLRGWAGVSFCAAGRENYWLGVSAEDQERWDERVPVLLDIPAKVRFVSAEPLLGEIKMGGHRPDWVIVGGESGPGARPMEANWVRSLRDQCAGNTAFFFKQWGGANKKATGRELDGITWSEFPIVNAEVSHDAERRCDH